MHIRFLRIQPISQEWRNIHIQTTKRKRRKVEDEMEDQCSKRDTHWNLHILKWQCTWFWDCRISRPCTHQDSQWRHTSQNGTQKQNTCPSEHTYRQDYLRYEDERHLACVHAKAQIIGRRDSWNMAVMRSLNNLFTHLAIPFYWGQAQTVCWWRMPHCVVNPAKMLLMYSLLGVVIPHSMYLYFTLIRFFIFTFTSYHFSRLFTLHSVLVWHLFHYVMMWLI